MAPSRQEAKVQLGNVGNGPAGQVGVLPGFLTGVAVARRVRRARVRERGRVDGNIMVVVEDGLGTLGFWKDDCDGSGVFVLKVLGI